MDRTLLVAHQNVLQAILVAIHFVIDGNDLTARITEDRIHSFGDERFQQNLGSCQTLSHKLSLQ